MTTLLVPTPDKHFFIDRDTIHNRKGSRVVHFDSIPYPVLARIGTTFATINFRNAPIDLHRCVYFPQNSGAEITFWKDEYDPNHTTVLRIDDQSERIPPQNRLGARTHKQRTQVQVLGYPGFDGEARSKWGELFPGMVGGTFQQVVLPELGSNPAGPSGYIFRANTDFYLRQFVQGLGISPLLIDLLTGSSLGRY